MELIYVRTDKGKLDNIFCSYGCARCLTQNSCTHCISGYFLTENNYCVEYPTEVYVIPMIMIKENEFFENNNSISNENFFL